MRRRELIRFGGAKIWVVDGPCIAYYGNVVSGTRPFIGASIGRYFRINSTLKKQRTLRWRAAPCTNGK